MNYWFCVNVEDESAMKRALSIFAYYKVYVRFLGNGDKAEIAIVYSENEDGDITLAEMAFIAPGCEIWRQARVCPVCKNQGEKTCGHHYFYEMVKAAF